jgi:hypothetical protein
MSLLVAVGHSADLSKLTVETSLLYARPYLILQELPGVMGEQCQRAMGGRGGSGGAYVVKKLFLRAIYMQLSECRI